MEKSNTGVESLKERLDYFKKHLIHLEENAHRLDYDFVEEERVSINNVIQDLEQQIKNQAK